MTDEEIAKGLTEAQTASLTYRAEFRSVDGQSEKQWMTFPAPNTHAVLMGLGLVDSRGVITPLGLRVRAILEKQDANT